MVLDFLLFDFFSEIISFFHSSLFSYNKNVFVIFLDVFISFDFSSILSSFLKFIVIKFNVFLIFLNKEFSFI